MLNDAFKNPLGWEGVEPRPDANKEMFDEINKKAFELCQLHNKVFGTEHGKKLLKLLVENTIESATWMASLPYNEAIAHGFAREGQNALVRDILNKIEVAKSCRDIKQFSAYLNKKAGM